MEIRRLCRELTTNGDDVIVLSNDASLIVGIPDSVYVANASKLSLVRNATTTGRKDLRSRCKQQLIHCIF